MGHVTGLAASRVGPYRLYARTKEGGLFRRDRTAGKWELVSSVFPAENSVAAKVESVAVCPVRPDRVYMATPARTETVQHPQFGSVAMPVGEVYVSDDAGGTWSPTGMADLADRVEMEGAGHMCWVTGERLAAEADGTLWFASRYDGLLRKQPGLPWKQVGGLPDPASLPGVNNGQGGLSKAGYTFVALPPAGSTGEGWTFVGVYGSGVWGSRGNGTWQRVSAYSNPVRCAVADDGTVYVAHMTDYSGGGRLLKLVPRGLRVLVADVTPPTVVTLGRPGLSGVAVDPGDSKRAFVQAASGGRLYCTEDGGASWGTREQRESFATVNRPDYFPTDASGSGRSAIVFDEASGASPLLQANRYGVLETTDRSTFLADQRWIVEGLYGATVNDFAVSATGTVAAVDDAVLLFGGSPVVRTFGSVPGKLEATGLDVSPTNPLFVAAVGGDDSGLRPFGGVSRDGGRTFEPFAALPSPSSQGGRVAVSAGNDANIVWAPTNWAPLAFTRDGGRTWANGLVAGTSYTLTSWHLLNMDWNGQVLAASRTRPGVFYFFIFGQIHRSEDGGATWHRIYDTNLPPNGVTMPIWAVETSIVPHPTRQNELWITFRHGDNDSRKYAALRSLDGGFSWNPVPDVVSGNYVAFGKGGSEPIAYLHGIVRVGGQNVEGVFRSKNPGVPGSWERIDVPGRPFTTIRGLAADMAKPGVVYVTTFGGGVVVGTDAQSADVLG